MAATGTFSWTGANGATWGSSSNWTQVGGSAPWSDAGATAYPLLFELGSGSGPYVVNLTSAVVVGAVAVSSANATIDVGSFTLKAAAGSVTGAGGTLIMNGGMVELAGGTLTFYQTSLGGGAEITGFGTISDPAYNSGSPTLTVTGAGSEIVASGGLLNIVGAGSGNEALTTSGAYEIVSGATLEFGKNAMLSSGTINFQGATDVLAVNTISNNTTNVGGTQVFNGTLQDMAAGATGGSTSGASVVDLQNLVVTSGSLVNGTIDVVAGGVTYQFNTTQTPSDYLNWTSDGGTGTDIWIDTNPCYAAGTRVLTERGEVAVEDLAEGDMVVTLSGDTRSLRPVRWIGNRRMNVRQHPQPNLVAPVRVRQHAFGENLPSRDLLLSPDHCLFVNGKLIPAKLLINDRTIVQERDTAAVHYYHVELDRHAVMFAEGLPAESYLDTGNRAMFSNAGLALMLHPDFEVNANLKCWETDACAPLAVSAEIVKPIHDRLADRAGSLGYRRQDVATSTDPELRLVADGRVIRPLSSDANRYVFTLPAGVSSVRLTSRAGVPSYFEAYLDDWRQLGVAVRRIVVRDSVGLIELPPDHPGLTQGWHKVEHDDATMWRWTNGDAVLPIGPTQAPTLVEIQVGMVMKHAVQDAAQDRLAA